LAIAAAGLKPFSASGARCEVNDEEEKISTNSILQYDELMAEYSAVCAAVADDVGATVQSFDQHIYRSSADGVHASAAVSLPIPSVQPEKHHLPMLAHRVEVALGVARELAVDVITLESSIATDSEETTAASVSRSTIVSTWGKPKYASRDPQKGASTKHSTTKSNMKTSGRAPAPAAHAAATAAHSSRIASTKHKKVADAHANSLKGRCVRTQRRIRSRRSIDCLMRR